MKDIAIIIPLYREQEVIATTLEHLRHISKIDRAEIILVDGNAGSTINRISPDYPLALRKHISSPGRARQMNIGAHIARAPVLLFLHADTRLPKSALSTILRTTLHYPAGAFFLGINSKNILIHTIGLVASLRSQITRIPFGDQAQFFTAELFHSIGGYPDIALMEDMTIMRTLRHRQIPIALLRPRVWTADRRWKKEGIFKCTLRNWFLQLSYTCGVSPDILAQWYCIHKK